MVEASGSGSPGSPVHAFGRDDRKYGFGEEVAPHAFACERSIAPGDIHCSADEADLDDLLSGFRLRSLEKREGWRENRGERRFFSCSCVPPRRS